MEYSCGCINEVDNASGVLHCVTKCNSHLEWSRTHPQGNTAQYFTELGLLEEGIPNNRRLIHQLAEALREMDDYTIFDRRHDLPALLELGCGLGSYVPLFLANGWLYEAIEQAEFSARWTRNCFDVIVHEIPFEEFESLGARGLWDAIFAAHFFEHTRDAPAMLTRAYNFLAPHGRLYLILPDDEDPTNPDHFWFFTQESLRGLLDQIGFKTIKMCMFRRTTIENFIYCVAEK